MMKGGESEKERGMTERKEKRKQMKERKPTKKREGTKRTTTTPLPKLKT
jgi:hypothetical protein